MGNEEILQTKAQKFFSELHRIQTQTQSANNQNDLNEPIALKISITNITKDAKYQIEAYNIIAGQQSPLCEKEYCIIDPVTNTAVLKTSIIMNYFFEKEQKMFVIINKFGEYTKNLRFDTTLGCIMGSRKTTLIKEIPNGDGEILNISAEKLKNSEEVFFLNFRINSNVPVNFAEVKNKLVFHFATADNRPIYNSECLGNNGRFNIIKIPVGLIDKGVNISFINCKRKELLNVKTTIQDLAKNQQFLITMSKRRQFTCISESMLTKEYTFVDYLKGGVRLGLSIAIDFTGSNGNPKHPKSLHYIEGREPNQYERAIFSCGNIMAYYDYDQLFPCYGFGAKINNQPAAIFNLNLQPDPNIHMIENVINAYHNALNYVTLYGPTKFSPILRATNEMIKAENDITNYQVLMILTDGMIDDVDDTINELVEGSFLPLSVIIIGVGKADFSTMNVLDADDNPLVDSNGRKSVRDLVQFVPFLKFEGNPERLAQEVLAEIPRQILEFYQQKRITPEQLMK